MSEAAQRIVHYSVRDGIAVITLNNPPVNSLGNALRAAIMEYLKKAEGDPAVKGAVLIGSAKAFSGGAGIREFNTPREKPDLAELNDQQDAMTKPLVAAIGGFALGGGLELALACHFRIALPKSRLGRHAAPAAHHRDGGGAAHDDQRQPHRGGESETAGAGGRDRGRGLAGSGRAFSAQIAQGRPAPPPHPRHAGEGRW